MAATSKKLAVATSAGKDEAGTVLSVPQDGQKGSCITRQGSSVAPVGVLQENHQDKESDNETGTAEAESGDSSSKLASTDQDTKDGSATACEQGDESFVVQEDDTVLNDIDADLLDGEGKGSQADGGDSDKNTAGQVIKAVTNTTTKQETKVVSKDGSKAAISTSAGPQGQESSAAKSAGGATQDVKSSQSSRNLWVSNLSSSTKASDIKKLFNTYGKVISAKVVTSASTPASKCFGLVTMSNADDANKSIQNLHLSDFRGRTITVERAKTETQGSQAKLLPPSGLKSPNKSPRADGPPEPKVQALKAGEDPSRLSKESNELTEKRRRELALSKIKAKHDQERLRRKEIFLERERNRQQQIEGRQREEAMKIEREKQRLREMRDELKRQQIETERLRLETERLQMEREQEKLRREKQRVLEERRPPKRSAGHQEEWTSKRPVSNRFHGDDRYEEDGGHEAREYNRRAEQRRSFREDRPARDIQPTRERYQQREQVRGPPRRDSRSEWKSQKEITRGSGIWNGPIDRPKARGWQSAQADQEESWDEGVVLSQSNGGYMQQGHVVTPGTVFIAQPAMQGGSVMMSSGMNRQSNNRYSASSNRRF